MSVAFEGYAAVWGRVDRAGDAVRRGAFADAGPVPLLWQHRGMVERPGVLPWPVLGAWGLEER